MKMQVTWQGDLPASPEAVWDALTRRSAGWLWEVSYEPWVGGAERGLNPDGGTVTVWEPERHLQTRSNDRTNQLDHRLEPRGDGTHVTYVHNGVVETDAELDACRRHTPFYLHSLGEYARHFAGRDATYRSAEAPGGFDAVKAALGIPADVAVGERVQFGTFEGVVDYADDAFLGVRSEAGLHRIYGRDAWGWPVEVAHHVFEPVRATAAVA